MKHFLSIFLAITFSCIYAKEVLIITSVFNKPEFIGWQKQLFDKFVMDEDGYRFVAFDDSNDDEMTKQMQTECKKWHVEYIRVPQEIHANKYVPRDPKWKNQNSASFRHSDVIQYMFDTFAFDHNGPVFLTDSDLFLMRPINFHQETNDYDIYALFWEAATGIKYTWSGLAIFRMDRLPEKRSMKFHCGSINGYIVDTCGNLFYYLQKNPQIRIKQAQCYCGDQIFVHNRYARSKKLIVSVDEQINQLKNLGFNSLEIQFLQRKVPDISWLMDNHFLHYSGASNYDHTQSPTYIEQKNKMMKQFIDEKLQI